MFPVERVLHGDHLVIDADRNWKGLCRLEVIFRFSDRNNENIFHLLHP